MIIFGNVSAQCYNNIIHDRESYGRKLFSVICTSAMLLDELQLGKWHIMVQLRV